jgi:hypothetical protein
VSSEHHLLKEIGHDVNSCCGTVLLVVLLHVLVVTGNNMRHYKLLVKTHKDPRMIPMIPAHINCMPILMRKLNCI